MFPMVLGVDGVGVVEQLGEGASRSSVGDDPVRRDADRPGWGWVGTYAEQCGRRRGRAACTSSQRTG